MKKLKSLLALLVLLASLFMFGALSSMAAPKFNANLNVNISSIKAGELVTAKAGVQNADPKESYQYKFVWSCNNWQKWGVINDFSSKSQVSLRPYTPGNYIIHVDIKDSKGNIITKSVPFKMDLGWDAKLSTSVPKRIIGETVSAKAGVTNPSNRMSYSYKFVWSCNNWQSWGVISDFSSKNNVSFTPKKQGNYVIYADIKDSLGNVVTKSSSFKMDLGWNASLSASVPSNKTGSTITAKANVTSSLENGNYKYKFVWSRNNWQSWGIISDFSSKNNVSFIPKNSGKYEIYADVKDKNGNILTRTSSFNIVTDWTAHNPTVNRTGSAPGSKVSITANPSKQLKGGQYKFVYSYNDWSEWGVIQNFSSNRYASFTPSKPGKYTVYTDIKDAYGNVNSSYNSFTIKGKLVALTFDDGPSNYTASILNTLNKYKVKGTFFVLGSNVPSHSAVIKQMHSQGHEIANHTYNHKNLTSLSASQINAEIQKTQNAVHKITGKYPVYLRPPYGAVNARVRANIKMPVVLWTKDTRDWQVRNADHVYRQAISNLKNGDIILFHDTHASTAKAIERIVPYLLKNGYYPVTISELMSQK